MSRYKREEPSAAQPAGAEFTGAVISVLTDPGHRGLRGAGVVSRCPRRTTDLAGGHGLDPGLMDHRIYGLSTPFAGS